jgi:hypothetical protein
MGLLDRGTNLDPEAFIRHIEQVFGNPHDILEALEILKDFNLKDGQHWNEFSATYDNLTTQAGMNGWHDEPRWKYLEQRLSQSLRDAIWNVELPKTYHLYVKELGLLAKKFETTTTWTTLRQQYKRPLQHPNTAMPRRPSATPNIQQRRKPPSASPSPTQPEPARPVTSRSPSQRPKPSPGPNTPGAVSWLITCSPSAGRMAPTLLFLAGGLPRNPSRQPNAQV